MRIAAVGLGAYTGVMLAIGLGLGRYWLSLPPLEFATWFTANFQFLLPTVLATLPLALAGTVWSLRLARDEAARRQWWIALALLSVTMVVTLAYHLPANIRIWSGELDDPQVRGELTWWLWFHFTLRIAPALGAAWLVAGLATGRNATSGT